MSYCTEIEFKKSTFGKNIIAKIKRNYSTYNRPITDSYFSTAFLNSFALQNNQSFGCYQDALRFWADARYEALVSEGLLSVGNDKYVKWLEDNENNNPLKALTDLFKSVPLVFGAIAIILLIKK